MSRITTLLFASIAPLISVQSTYAQYACIKVSDFTEQHLFYPKSVHGSPWMQNGSQYGTLENDKIVVYDISTGSQVATLLDGNTLPNALQRPIIASLHVVRCCSITASCYLLK